MTAVPGTLLSDDLEGLEVPDLPTSTNVPDPRSEATEKFQAAVESAFHAYVAWERSHAAANEARVAALSRELEETRARLAAAEARLLAAESVRENLRRVLEG